MGTELSVQIKKAIKAKLQEMQCYVDDELPDYIMVMIANKKTTDQMTEDLKIFLSEGSVDFCKWLSEVLERLDKVGKESPDKKEKKQEEKKTPPGRSRSSSRGKIRKTSSPRRRISKSRSPKPLSKRSDRDSRNAKTSSTNQSSRKVVDSVDAKKRSDSGDRDKGKRAPDKDKKRERSRSDGEKSKSKDKGHSSRKKTPEKVKKDVTPMNERVQIPDYKKTGQTIVIKNEYSEEQNEPPVNDPIDTLREASPLSSEENEMLTRKSDSDNGANIEQSNRAESPEPPRKASPVPNIQQKVVAKISPMMSVVDTDSSTLLSPPKIHVKERLGPRLGDDRKTGVVKPRVVASLEDTSSNDLRMRLDVRQGTRKSRTIREKPQRKSVLETDFKTLNNIFSKALHDVKTVEVSKRSKKAVEEYDPLRPDIRRRAKIFKMPRVTVQNENAEVAILRLAAKRTQRKNSTSKKRHHSASEESSDDARDKSRRSTSETKQSRKRRNDSREREIVSEENSESESKSKATKFVVSLKGASKFIDKVKKYGKKDMSDSELEEVSDEESVSEMESENDNFNEDDETDNSPKKNVSLYKKQTSETNSTTQDGDTAKESQEVNLERCKFWPACKLGDQCVYVHPVKPCSKFPNCSFGDSCLFIHPACKYGSSCMNPSCNFAHSGGKKSRNVPLKYANPFAASTVAKPQVKETPKTVEAVCKYGTQCKAVGCHYVHPKIMKDCAFGVSCRRKNKGCKYLHGTGISKFKWSSAKNPTDLSEKRAELKSH